MHELAPPSQTAAPPMPVLPTPVAPRARRDGRVIVALVAVDAVLTVVLAVAGGRSGVQIFATVFLGIFIEAMPFVLVGALISGAIGVFVRDETVTRFLPRGRVAAPLVGSLLGLIFPVCECGVVPVTRRLVHKGAAVSLGIAFLLASPVINPIVLWSTYAAFGGDWHMVAWRAGLTFAIAVLVGIVFSFHPQSRALLQSPPDTLGFVPSGETTQAPDGQIALRASHVHPQLSWPKRLHALFQHSAIEFFEMGKFLVFGGLLAALLQTLVPRQALLAIGQSPVTSVLAMVLLAVVLSVCSTVDAFLVLTFASTFTSGAILAFLVFGPMVDIKSTFMFLTGLKGRAVALMILLAALLVLLATIFINLNLAW